ncbi:MAG: ketoacyl-ACP synthase III [Christensenella sp.]
MLKSVFHNVKITGISCAVPTKYVSNESYYPLFGKEDVDKIIDTTGIKGGYHVHEKQTASDLAFVAADRLLTEKNIDRSTIGALIFVVSYPDYFVPSTACVLQKRLNLSMDCLVFDMNMACSGFVFGLHTAASFLQSTNISRALVLVGDSTSKVVSPNDKSRMLFGDAGGAALIELDDNAETINFGLKNDGARFKSIIVPAGAFRMPNAPREQTVWFDQNTRSDYNLFMNGADVFSFTMSDVPSLLKEFMEFYETSVDDVDALVFHQPNGFILKHLAKKVKIPLDKVPLSLPKYGNTSGVSIPVTLCDAYGAEQGTSHHIIICGFGVGLSWGVASLTLETDGILPIIHTDDYYTDGLVEHE